MLDRVLEPELMDDPSESQAYDDMDHGGVNVLFVSDFLANGEPGYEVLDLGTGTARIPIELCRQHEACRVLASDAAISMLEIAKINVAIEGFEHRIQLHHGDSKSLEFEDAMFDSVISNSLIHHLPTPAAALKHIVRIVRPGGRVFVRDLVRPSSEHEIERLVATYAASETKDCQQLLRQSFFAALTLEEIRALVVSLGFDAESVQMTSDRHWTWADTKPLAVV